MDKRMIINVDPKFRVIGRDLVQYHPYRDLGIIRSRSVTNGINIQLSILRQFNLKYLKEKVFFTLDDNQRVFPYRDGVNR